MPSEQFRNKYNYDETMMRPLSPILTTMFNAQNFEEITVINVRRFAKRKLVMTSHVLDIHFACNAP